MKKFSKILSVALLVALVLSLGVANAFAADPPADDPDQYGVQNQEHTITVESNGTGVHKYEVYQVFYGNLNATEGVLSDIQWGNGVESAALLSALKTNAAFEGKFADCETAAQVAKVLGDNGTAAFAAAFADVVSENLGTKANEGSTPGGEENNKVDIKVYGDGYYFIKDVTEDTEDGLEDGDTASKYILEVVENIEIVAKDTVLKPDKEILKAQGQDFTRVKEDSAAVGDVVTFEVTIPVPDTKAYIDHFVFIMNDQLPAGLTFFGMDSVKINGADIPAWTSAFDENPGTNAAYTLTAKTGESAFTVPTTVDAAVAAAGGQTLEIVFNNFKAYVEAAEAIGKNVVITYKAVVNDDAVYGSTGNENEVYFEYSNNPNHDYDGDKPGTDEPTGVTPYDRTKTFVAGLKILKVNGSNNNNPLAGAEFEITSDTYNKTVTKGTKFVEAPYTEGTGETIERNTDGETVYYWKLKDGSFTTSDPDTEVDGKKIYNPTQYDSTTQKYVKVSWDKIVVTPGESKKVTLVTGKDGIIDINGLKPGTYTIKETHAPDGFNKIDTEYTLVVDWVVVTDPVTNKETHEFSLTSGDSQQGFSLEKYTYKDASGAEQESLKAIYKIQIVNNSGATLPSTGGIGTTIFYVVGGVLVLAAIILLVTKKRMSE